MAYEKQIIEQLIDLGSYDEAAQEFLKETIRCLRAKAYRATTILAWTTLIFFLYTKIAENGIGPFIKLAKEKGIPIPKSINTFYDLNKFDDRRVIELAHAMGIFDQNALKILIQCLDKRNSYAHVGQPSPDELNTLAYLQEIIKHIGIIRQSRFEHRVHSLLQILKELPYEARRVKISQLGFEQIKSLSLQILNDLQYAGGTTSLDDVDEHISLLAEIVNLRINKAEMLSLLELVLECYRLRSLSITSSLSLLKPLQLLLRDMDTNRYFVEHDGIDLLLRVLIDCNSWPSSNIVGELLISFVQHFTEDNIITLIQMCEENDQVCEAWRIIALRSSIVKRFSGKLPKDLLGRLEQLDIP